MNRLHVANISLGVMIFAAAALIAADLAAHRLSRLFPARSAEAPAPARRRGAEDFASLAPIVEKGLFGPQTRGKLAAVSRQTQGPATAPAASASDLILLGTATGSFRETFALVQKGGTREERVFRLGDKVFDAGPLLAVRKDSAVVLVAGKKVTLSTPAAPGGSSSTPGGPASPTPPATSGSLATSVGGGSFIVDGRALNAALDNVGQTMTDARLLPSMKDGRVEGFRLSEVKPAGVFGMLGLRNGDVLLSLNDFPVDSPDKALQSFVSLKGQSRLKVDIVRDNHPVTLNYDVR